MSDQGATGPLNSGGGPDCGQLEKAFQLFMEKAVVLEDSHAKLQSKVERLTTELAQKVVEMGALKDYLASVLESVADAVIATDCEVHITSLNRAAEELLGLTEERCVFRPLCECGEAGSLLARLAWAAASGGERVHSKEQELLRPDKGRMTMLVSAAPLRDVRGNLTGAVISAQDVSQLRDLERAVARKERLAALGEMAAVLAHEIRNPLGGIQLYAGILGRSSGLSAAEIDIVGKLSKGIVGLNKLVDDMLAFAREIVANRVQQDVRLVVEGALEQAVAELDAKGIMVEREGWLRPLDAPVDADLLRRAFLNLILNAADAVDSGGRLKVAARYEQACNGKWLALSVSDDGRGISAEDSEKVANPFFTTKAKGTGLGLAVVNRIVGAHGGEMKIERNGQLGGATVEVRLPVSL